MIMKHTVQIKKLSIGEGMPKICVPVTGADSCEILSQAEQIKNAGPDLVEWRADFYENLKEKSAVEDMLESLGAVLGDIPLLFTVRTGREGGNVRLTPEEYEDILVHAASCVAADVLDVEIMPDQESAVRIIDAAHGQGKPVIASNHHFEGTPSNDTIDCIFSCMEQAGADILKMAVMPNNSRDVIRMMERTLSWNEKSDRPMITMSMGKLGGVSRMCGELTGSCMTFGSVTAASAPGQIPMDLLKKVLWLMHE